MNNLPPNSQEKSQRLNVLFKILLIALLTFFVAIISACISSVAPTTPKYLEIAMNNAKQQRSQAEQRVLLAKQYYEKTKINNIDYQNAEDLYETARNAFDIWINHLQKNIYADRDIDNPTSYDKLADIANKQSKKFNDFVDQIILQNTTRGSREAVNTLYLIASAGIEILQAIKKLEHTKKLKLISDLEELRWQAFDNI